MKRSKKSVVTIILAAMMIAAMAVSALAEVGTKIAITNNNSGNTFSIYKVMSAEKVGVDNKGADLYAYTVESVFADFFKDGANGYTLNEQNQIMKGNAIVAGDTRATNSNSTDAAELAAALAKFAREKNITATAETNDKNGVDQLALGYYLVAQTATGKTNDKEVASKPILIDLTKGNAEIEAKNDTTDLKKVIVENDTEVKANNVNIGDTVNFKITTKIPTYEAGLNERIDEASLVFELKDTFCEGLTYNESSLVIAGFEKDTDYTASYADGVLTISFTKASILANQGKSVVATYSAVLNDKAKVESTEGNENDVELKYTNNPDQKDDFKTLTDETKTYTYGFKIHKVDKAAPSTGLDDAIFTIQSEDGTKSATFKDNGDGTYTFAGFVGKDEDAPAGTTKEIKSQGGGLAEVKGLDAGTYKMTETQAPDEYTKLAEDITITIEDKNIKDGKDTPNGIAVVSASGGGNAGVQEVTDKFGNRTGSVEDDGNGTINLAVYVENAKGISLPETGATSALVCMIGGALIVLIGLLYYFFAVRRSSKKASR